MLILHSVPIIGKVPEFETFFLHNNNNRRIKMGLLLLLFEFVGSDVFFVEFVRSFGAFEGFEPREREEGRETKGSTGGGG